MNSYSILCLFLISFSVHCTFKHNNIYYANHHLILSFLPSNVTAQDGFFYNGSIGQEHYRVFIIAYSDCIKTASDGLIQSCPNQTDAFLSFKIKTIFSFIKFRTEETFFHFLIGLT